MQILVPTEQVERQWGLKPPAVVVHNKFGWAAVPQMWVFSLCTAVLAMPWPKLAVVAQVVCRNLLLQTGTSFWHSLEFGSGKQH